MDEVIDRIVAYTAQRHKIIAAPSEGLLTDELLGVLSRAGKVNRGRSNRRTFILDAIQVAVERGRLERFIDEFGIIIALPNEWPPSSLTDFVMFDDIDFEPAFDPAMLRHVRNNMARRELQLY